MKGIYTALLSPEGLEALLCVSRSALTGGYPGSLTDTNHTTDRITTRKYLKEDRFLDVGGNRSTRRKPTKTGMESVNQVHVQPLASCIGEREVLTVLHQPALPRE